MFGLVDLGNEKIVSNGRSPAIRRLSGCRSLDWFIQLKQGQLGCLNPCGLKLENQGVSSFTFHVGILPIDKIRLYGIIFYNTSI